MHTTTSRTRAVPEDFGWSAEDLRSAFAADGSGPFRYAPDGTGPFSHDPDGSGPWWVGPDTGLEARVASATPVAFPPRARGSRAGRRRIVRAAAGGALALVLVAGSVGVVGLVGEGHSPSTVHASTSVLHTSHPRAD